MLLWYRILLAIENLLTIYGYLPATGCSDGPRIELARTLMELVKLMRLRSGGRRA